MAQSAKGKLIKNKFLWLLNRPAGLSEKPVSKAELRRQAEEALKTVPVTKIRPGKAVDKLPKTMRRK